MNPAGAPVMAFLDGCRDLVINWQRDLVATPAIGPDNQGQGEAAKAALIETWWHELGLAVERCDAPDERVPGGLRPNLVGRTFTDRRPTVWILGHLDVVPVGDRNLWGGDPFELRVKRNRVFGRGVQDNHQALVASLLVARALQETGARPERGLGLCAVSDEETGSRYGLDYLLTHRPDLFSAEDLIVVPDHVEEGGLGIEVAEKSICWLKFIINGRQCHASTPHLGLNTLHVAARLILALEGLRREFDAEDDLFRPPASTFECTKIEANVDNINTVPGRDVVYLDARVLPVYDFDKVAAAARMIAGDIEVQTGASIEVVPVQFLTAPPPTPPDAPVVKAIERAVAELRGTQARPIGIGGGTVAAFFRRRGLHAAVWASGPSTMHMPDEYCFISDIIDDAKVLAHLLWEHERCD